MAEAYASVLNAQNRKYLVVGRGFSSASRFTSATGIDVLTGGVERALASNSAPSHAIVSVGILELANVADLLVQAGCKNILLEKPGSLFTSELTSLNEKADAHGASIWIAYNRRFYRSVEALRSLVATEGGITSTRFCFTELSTKVASLPVSSIIKQHWLIANSSHVIDLAFHLIGHPKPDNFAFFRSGSLHWHERSSLFTGSGISDQDTLFSYHADWCSSGRWGLQIHTCHNCYTLMPLERLQVTPKDSFDISAVDLDYSLDTLYKPGLYAQCEAFFSHDTSYLCSLKEQIKSFPIYSQIAGY